MTALERELVQQFYNWEIRGRGWLRYPEPVALEPPFRPFHGYRLPSRRPGNAGQMPTLLSSIVRKVQSLLDGSGRDGSSLEEEEEAECAPRHAPVDRELASLQALLPPKVTVSPERMEGFLSCLKSCHEPLALELVSTADSIGVQWTMGWRDRAFVEAHARNWFPEAVFLPRDENGDLVKSAVEGPTENDFTVVEFGLDREFLLPLATPRSFDPDPLLGLFSVLGDLQEGEALVYQVLFEPAACNWAESMVRLVTGRDGAAVFADAPELTGTLEEKIASPLYSSVMRLGISTANGRRSAELLNHVCGALEVFSRPEGNRLVVLAEDEEKEDYLQTISDLLRRRSRRSGMLLNLKELVSLAHLPGASIRTQKLVRQVRKTKSAPSHLLAQNDMILGINEHAGAAPEVGLSSEERVRHMHVIGASGTGKSNFLLNCIIQDIRNGNGLAVLDPHGDLVDKLVGYIPEERHKDVILFDPSDQQYPIGFNVLSARSELERTLLASDLCSVFRRQSSSWGDQMTTVLSNAILAFLESERGGTLSDLRRFLLEDGFRKEFLTSVKDPEVVYYWRKNFPHVSGKPQASVVTRLDSFLRPKAIRYMVAQRESRLDFAGIMDTGKIFLAKLPQGLIGEENAQLLGSLLVSKFQQTAISRQSVTAAERRDFWLYVDECHHFVTPSMANILTGARKYRMGLVLAHQELRQLLNRDAEVGGAVLANPATRVCFRLGEDDARKLSEGFSFFDASDLVNLGVGEALARVERSEWDFNLRIGQPERVDQTQSESVLSTLRHSTRERYARTLEEVEKEYLASVELSPESERVEQKRVPPAPAAVKEAAADPVENAPSAVPAEHGGTPPELQRPGEAQPVEAPASPHFEGAVDTPPVTKAVKQLSPKGEMKDLGKGGAQHQAIQLRLKAAAEELGFRATIEKQILAGAGSVDLLVERFSQVIACEISITNTVDYEVGNIAKCAKAGFEKIVMVCADAGRLQKISAAVGNSLGAEIAARIKYFLPDEFIEHLRSLPGDRPPAVPGEEQRRGYKVKRTFVKLSPQEATAQEQEALRLMREAQSKRSRNNRE